MYPIILNMKEINLTTDRTNFVTREREEVTSKKVGSTETWFGGETDNRY